MNRAITFPAALLIFGGAAVGWAMAIPVAVVGRVALGAFRQ